MSKSYTPGLKILKNTKILKERRLPLNGDINCQIGDQVKNDTIVASTSIPGNIHMVNIVRQLNIDAQSVKDYLTIKINPALAFGTGHHETTYMMIEAMLSYDFNNKSIFDIGTGSGILSILHNHNFNLSLFRNSLVTV